MNDFLKFLNTLNTLDIRLQIENGNIRYSAPAGVITNDILSDLKKHKAELIEHFASKKETIKPIERTERHLLSFAQMRIWFLDVLEEESFIYNLPMPIKLKGMLNLATFTEALKLLFRRHEVLRTTFFEDNGKVFQKIVSTNSPEITITDISDLHKNEQERFIKKSIEKEARTPFSLRSDSLLRTNIWKVSDDEHILLITTHHIIFDGWSINIFLRELSEYYTKLTNNEKVKSDIPDIQYIDYADWHSKWMQTNQAQKQIAYWKDKLASAPELLQIPTKQPRPAEQTFNGKTLSFKINELLQKKLKTVSDEKQCSMFMLLFTGFITLLYRYTNQHDIVIGSTIANRNKHETESMLGLFANTIALRNTVNESLSFYELLEQVKQTVFEALENQDIPFEKIVEEIQPERSLSYPPLFQVMFELQDSNEKAFHLPGIELIPLEMENVTAKFDLSCMILNSDGKLYGTIEYNADLFDESFIQRMAEHYIILLEQSKKNFKISTVDFLSEKEKYQLLSGFNNNAVEFPVNKSYMDLFSTVVEKFPNSIAAKFRDTSLTYQSLYHKVSVGGNYLLQKGVKEQQVVALLADRDINFLITMLAILHCNAIYLPLDPKHPTHRIKNIINKSDASFLIVSENYKHIADDITVNDSSLKQNQIIDIGDICTEINITSDDANFSQIDSLPKDSTYIIFTSGSTGEPKGAIVQQKGMINHLFAKIHDLNLTDQDIVAQNASQCFDISVWQFLAPLLVGGSVDMIPDEIIPDTSRFLNEVKIREISILEVVPSFMDLLIKEVIKQPDYSFPKLRWLIPTGEALPPSIAKDWLYHFPKIPLMNAYGPTECSDDVTHYKMYTFSEIDNYSVSIGKPIPNVSLYILDKHFNPLPLGITGEIYVSGVCVGKGYINDQKKTEDCFIRDPFREENTVMYKTGDLGKYRPDGSIEFLGRIDSQVKIHGFRIELSEIDNVLKKHPAVRNASVITDQTNDTIIAYIVATDNIQNSMLIEYLSEHLPEYMIPSVIIRLDEMPLNANGKIDKKSLPKSSQKTVQSTKPIQYPETQTEKTIYRIWKEVLKKDSISVHDNFFEIGGHSLIAMQVLSRIKEQCSNEISIKYIFEKQTIKELSAFIESLIEKNDSDREEIII